MRTRGCLVSDTGVNVVKSNKTYFTHWCIVCIIEKVSSNSSSAARTPRRRGALRHIHTTPMRLHHTHRRQPRGNKARVLRRRIHRRRGGYFRSQASVGERHVCYSGCKWVGGGGRSLVRETSSAHLLAHGAVFAAQRPSPSTHLLDKLR